MKDMIRNWSVDETTSCIWHDDLALTDDAYEFAFHFLANNKPIKSLEKRPNDYLVYKDKNSSYVNLNLWYNKFSKAKNLDFEGIVSSFQKVKLVSLNKLKWTSSKCSCACFK